MAKIFCVIQYGEILQSPNKQEVDTKQQHQHLQNLYKATYQTLNQSTNR